MSEYTVVGQKVARVDAVEKVTGAAPIRGRCASTRYALRQNRPQ